MIAPLVPVRELAEQIRGVTYSKGEASSSPRIDHLPILRAGNITDEGISLSDLIFVPRNRISSKQQIQRNDVVIAASSGSLDVVGKAAQARQDLEGSFGAFCKVLRPNSRVDPRYFAHYFRTPTYRAKISSLAAGANINNLRNEHLDELKVPLPPLEEQRGIATVLDRADELRAKRREAFVHLADLTRSIFLDMFGDPRRSPNGWEQRPLGSLCSIAGEYGAGVPAAEFSSILPRYVRITDVTEGGSLTSEPVSPGGSESEWVRYRLAPGDILFARSGATVGKTYIHRSSNGDCVFAGYLIRFRPNPELVLPEYVFGFTRTSAYKDWVSVRQRTVAQPNINAKQYGQELLLPVPPLALQREFAKRVAAIAALNAKHQASSAELDALFASLQDRAFRGLL